MGLVQQIRAELCSLDRFISQHFSRWLAVKETHPRLVGALHRNHDRQSPASH
jgi:hypothetical protein